MQRTSSSPFGSWFKNPVVIIASAAVVLGFNMGTRQTFGLFLEPVTVDLSISRSNFSLAIAIQNLLWGFLTPVFGGLADRFGTARCIAVGGLLYVLGILLMLFSLTLVVPAIVAVIYDEPFLASFGVAFAITFTTGLVFWFARQGSI